MPTVAAIRDGLKTRLETISGLRAYDTVPGAPNLPCAIVMPDGIAYDTTCGRGADTYAFLITVLVSDADSGLAQDALDGYCNGTGATSIKTAIEGEQTLGGLVSYARVVALRDYGTVKAGGVDYLGGVFMLEVLG